MPRTWPSIRRRRSSTSDCVHSLIGRTGFVSDMFSPNTKKQEPRTKSRKRLWSLVLSARLSMKLADQRLVEGFLEDALGSGTLDALDLFAALEDDHRRDGHDPQRASSALLFVGVDLGDRQLAFVLARQLF